jgi:putative membrane protein
MPESPEPPRKKTERILILCVDRDDDVGIKARVNTPVVGREENLSAAVSLALADPEEPDANAMFEAVRIHDRLKQKAGLSEEHQVATIAGSELVGVEADRKLVSELTSVMEAFPANGVILVTDGYADEAILPLIESRVPVNSVRRIVIKHSVSIEETAAVFSRYLKMLWQNPRYSRYVFGFPGILIILLMVLYAAFSEPGLYYAGLGFLLILGVVFLVKGFGIDRKAVDTYRWIRSPPPLPMQIIGFSSVAGVMLIGIGCYLGGVQISNQLASLQPPPADFGQWITVLPLMIGWFIERAITLIAIGICVLLVSGALRFFLERSSRLWRSLVFVFVTVGAHQIFYEASQLIITPEIAYDRFLAAVLLGILLAIVSSLTARTLRRRYIDFFKEEEVEEFKG